MESIISYFETIPSSHRSLILVGGITLFWLIESAVPLFTFKYKKWQHAGLNIFFTLTTIVINFALAFILLKTADWTVENDFGILQWIPELPLWAYALIGLLLLDLIGAYLVHWAEHKVKWMWRFHLIHHTDTWIDTTSANRHHPGESVFRFAFTTLGVLLVGTPMWLVFMYQSISVLLSQFNHANISLPKWLDKLISYVIISPDMHKVHHHYVLPYTNSNYGNIFSIWDRLFGTYMTLNRDKLVYGIDTHMDEIENNRIPNLLKIPFQEYRQPSDESLMAIKMKEKVVV
ncbi:sterol desaturase family protein [Jiulongibacter sediminis]|uniref:Sterol desaturase n=1 Tax=Jiulongibacter sediminis TaxID=1605367 RepID=A0A0P7C9L9_9BACT|nr:sterol desaturase family protein [Jiulongibacter sediminis]KPM49208.1 sterol desaturase [Jiulongibacter sediminis]TBX26263.1 sterol desaturase [Jiulongibacter sediminis]